MRMVFLEKSSTKCGGEASPTLKIESKSKLSTSLDQQCEMLQKFVFIVCPSQGLPKLRC